MRITMKYYIYISDAKVDALLPQILNEIKSKQSTEFKIDLKILSFSSKSETEDNRISRLAAVCEFIKEYGNVGTIKQPDEYIYDMMSADMAIPDSSNWPQRAYSDWSSDYVYFGGQRGDTLICLGGSARHLIGVYPPSINSYISSAFPVMVRDLQRCVSHPNDKDFSILDSASTMVTEYLKNRTQKIEFLAKRLAYGQGNHSSSKVLFGTPLYVSMADEARNLK
jgi:hypothetical protein